MLVVGDFVILRVQMTSQGVIVIEPPKGGIRKEEEFGSLGAEILELIDGVLAVRRIIAGIFAVVGLRKMPAFAFA